MQPILKTLAGRNVLLGPLVEATFTAIAPISIHKAIVCTEKGDVCLLDDSEGQKLIKLASTGFFITCLAVDIEHRRVKIGGRNGRMRSISLDELLNPSPPESPKPILESAPGPDLCAMGYAAHSLVTIDSNNSIEISGQDSDAADLRMQKLLSAHGDSVLGICLLSAETTMSAAFLTWSASGTIVFWNLDGSSKGSVKVEIEQISTGDDDPVNQCQIVRVAKNAAFLVAGDKYGVLRILKLVDLSTPVCELETRAHMSDIQDIALYESENTTMIASCSRDRTVQLFRLLLGEWVLVQTLDDHSASVCSLFFAENGEKLISCSTDRTIHIRQLVKKDVGGQDVIGAVPIRIITLKASPVSMAACFADQMGDFVVSLLDRSVASYEIASGRLISSFRATDSEGAEAVVLDALVMGKPSSIPGRPTILAGISSTDKSVRVYDGVTGAFLDREFGHTASVTDVALLETEAEEKVLISSGAE